jgi:Transposase C of IS166 homeodomain
MQTVAIACARHSKRAISHDNEIEHLKLLILKLKRMQFGPSSEKLARHIDQLELRLEDLETNRASQPMSLVLESILAVSKPARRPLPAELPRETVTLPPNGDAVPIVAARWIDWARMFQKHWNTFRPASR